MEPTRSGPVFSPSTDIFENENVITVLADMPGVRADNLRVDLRERVLTLEGHAEAPEAENEEKILSEYTSSGTFYRQFTLSDTIDQSKIEATLHDGVLRVTLPKVEEAKPRQIEIKTTR